MFRRRIVARPGRQHGGHLVDREHRRNPARGRGSRHLVHPGQIDADHLAIEEQQCRQRLFVCRDRDPPHVGQVGQERLDLGGAHVLGVAHAVESDVGAAPGQVGLLGLQAVVQVPDALAQLVQQALRLQRRAVGRRAAARWVVHAGSLAWWRPEANRPEAGCGWGPACFDRRKTCWRLC